MLLLERIVKCLAEKGLQIGDDFQLSMRGELSVHDAFHCRKPVFTLEYFGNVVNSRRAFWQPAKGIAISGSERRMRVMGSAIDVDSFGSRLGFPIDHRLQHPPALSVLGISSSGNPGSYVSSRSTSMGGWSSATRAPARTLSATHASPASGPASQIQWLTRYGK